MDKTYSFDDLWWMKLLCLSVIIIGVSFTFCSDAESKEMNLLMKPPERKSVLYVQNPEFFIGRTIQGVMIITGCYSKPVEFFKFFQVSHLLI